jgi:uncharacterized protein
LVIHPDTELRFVGAEVGYGVVATRLIPAGTVTWVLDSLDQRIPPDKAKALRGAPKYAALLDRFGYSDGEGNIILCWDHGRFVNHSCDPTCASTDSEELQLALRDILPGEQLTDDYAEYSLHESFACRCGAESCRGTVSPVDRAAVLSALRGRATRAHGRIHAVAQPLWSLVESLQ